MKELILFQFLSPSSLLSSFSWQDFWPSAFTNRRSRTGFTQSLMRSTKAGATPQSSPTGLTLSRTNSLMSTSATRLRTRTLLTTPWPQPLNMGRLPTDFASTRETSRRAPRSTTRSRWRRNQAPESWLSSRELTSRQNGRTFEFRSETLWTIATTSWSSSFSTTLRRKS